MEVEIIDGKLVIKLPIAPHTSKSGKSTIIATTSGNKTTELEHDGKKVVIGVNAYTLN